MTLEYIQLLNFSVRKAYRVVIEAKTKKEIYFRFPKKMVEELSLECDEEFAFDIQFELNRVPLCEMHYALDNLCSLDSLFPKVSGDLNIPWNPTL